MFVHKGDMLDNRQSNMCIGILTFDSVRDFEFLVVFVGAIHVVCDRPGHHVYTAGHNPCSQRGSDSTLKGREER